MRNPSIRRVGAPRPLSEAAAEWALRQKAGGFSEAEDERFAAWLAEDGAHVEAYEDAVWALDAASQYAGDARIRDMRAAALAARGHRRWPKWTLGALGGAVAAALVVMWFVAAQPSFLARPGAQFAGGTAMGDPARSTHRTRIGERLALTLPDGSVATLDTGSELRVAYTVDERAIYLIRGQAMFEVAHGQRAPFRVFAGNQEIRAVGTAFNVRLDGDEVRVALIEGIVKVRPQTAGNGLRSEVTMRAGEALEAIPARPVAVRAADVSRAASWRSGELVFNDTRLADAVAEINRYTPRPIRIEDPEIGDYRISGVFRTSDPGRFSEAVGEVLPVAAVRRDDGALVLRAPGD